MKKIVPALNKVQLVCQDASVPLSELGKARKELFAAIREVITGAALAATKDTASCIVEGVPKTNLLEKYLIDFDKLNGG